MKFPVIKLDKVIEYLISLGVPGLILLVAISASGYAGAAAITAALSTIGFGLGMLAGLGVLGVSIMVSRAISKYGFERIYSGTVKGLIEKGETKESILSKVNKYPISKDLKLKLKELLEDYKG
ncbi:MAG: hypothetical protein CMC14_14025 [Flavobacteriaceae bacterium]|nr:hypothetical protein [Flavobacteriaceae bacterium]|tara:strand:- start:18 stop:386 length:369 start_codon:yes stop_codon:yes gene_type:complete